MTKPTLGGNLPQSPVSNALIGIEDDLIQFPKETRLAIVEIDVNILKRKVHDGSITPVLQLSHIEVLTGKDKDEATKILDRAFTARTGENVRPAKVEDTPLDMSGVDDEV